MSCQNFGPVKKKQPLDGVRYFDMALPALRTNGDNAIFKGRDKATRAGRAVTRNSMVFFIPSPVYKKTARRFQELRDYREFREKKMMGAVKKQLKTESGKLKAGEWSGELRMAGSRSRPAIG